MRDGVRGQRLMFYIFSFLFVCHRQRFRYVVDFCQKDKASVFVDQFRCGLQRFFVEEMPFPAYGTDLKSVARVALRFVPDCPRKLSKSEKMGATICVHHFDHLEAS